MIVIHKWSLFVGYTDQEKRNEYARKWRAENLDRARATDVKRRRAMTEVEKDARREYMKQYRANNPDYVERSKESAKKYLESETGKQKRHEWQTKYMSRPEIRERQRKVWREWAKEDRAKNPERHRSANLKKGYGITIPEYETMLAAQQAACAICGKKVLEGRRLHVDHCHETGALRKLLCHGCNTGIGLMGDNPERLEAAAAYIRSHKR